MRALVREDHAVLVRLGAERGDEALARACDAVGPDVLLREPPVRRLRLLDEHPVLAPAREVAGGLLLRVGQRQPHDVVRAALLVLLALLVGDDVVRRRDEPGERPGDRLVEAERAKSGGS